MTDEDFAFFARLLRRRSGLVLSPDKAALLHRRLQPVLCRFGLKDVPALLRQLRLGQEALAGAVTEAMTVNETSFFRGAVAFARLREYLLARLETARGPDKRLRIWSAAAAAGQEAYSVAMLLDEMGFTAQGWTVELIASDISADAVRRAQQGRYSLFEVQRGLSLERLARYFAGEADGSFIIAERLRRAVSFRRFNLLDCMGWLDGLDIILCRNVLLYFDRATKASVLERMADGLRDDGVLLLGETEAAPQAGFVELPGGGLYAKDPQARLRAAS